MNSEMLTYQLPTFTGLVRHGARRTLFLRDKASEHSNQTEFTLEAQVRSGDYFVSLATALDLLARGVTDYNIRLKLEDIVSELIHLQDNYAITKKDDH